MAPAFQPLPTSLESPTCTVLGEGELDLAVSSDLGLTLVRKPRVGATTLQPGQLEKQCVCQPHSSEDCFRVSVPPGELEQLLFLAEGPAQLSPSSLLGTLVPAL